jgi:hypothetical protein
MSELDIAKERIAYLKVWLGILLVTDISVIGWLITNFDTASSALSWTAALAVLGLGIGIFLLHRRIDRHIESLGPL